MLATAVLCSDRPGFESLWRPACNQYGLRVSLAAPDQAPQATSAGNGVVFDAGCDAFREPDELLAAVALVRARGGIPAVAAEANHSPAVGDRLVEDLCAGLVARSGSDVDRVSAILARRVDAGRAGRFEFVTVAPGSRDLLAILGDGQCHLVPRPVTDSDDLSEVVGIELSEDAGQAELRLATGARFRLELDRVRTSKRPVNGVDGGIPVEVEGPRLGARLRQLRKAAGLTQAELARRTGIHRPNIARVEAGRHTPSLETLARLASAIGVPTTAVLMEG